MVPLSLPSTCRSLESYWSILNLSIFAKGNLLLCYIQPSTWGNQRGARELPFSQHQEISGAIAGDSKVQQVDWSRQLPSQKAIFGAVAGDSSLQDRGVAHYLLSLLFSLVSLPFSFYFCVPYKKYKKYLLPFLLMLSLPWVLNHQNMEGWTCFTWLIFDQFVL